MTWQHDQVNGLLQEQKGSRVTIWNSPVEAHGGEAGGAGMCHHTPTQRYTRQPCSCGRTLWPPRGRGRGEALLSRRRVAAKLRALEALELWSSGLSYRRIAAQLGYQTAGGAWRAVQRLFAHQAEWERHEAETGYRPRWRHEPSPTQVEGAIQRLTRDLEWDRAGRETERERHAACRKVRRQDDEE